LYLANHSEQTAYQAQDKQRSEKLEHSIDATAHALLTFHMTAM